MKGEFLKKNFNFRDFVPKKTFKLYGPFLWMGFKCLKPTEPLKGSSFLFTTHLINLR